MIYQFLGLLIVHFIADFILQTHWQASNKSKNWEALGRHVGTYTLVLSIGTVLIFMLFPMKKYFEFEIITFVIVNGILHFITDAITSRINSYYYAKQDWHNFFVGIGADQLIHQVTLALTMIYFFK